MQSEILQLKANNEMLTKVVKSLSDQSAQASRLETHYKESMRLMHLAAIV
jgi:hypothetical protein